MPQRHAPYGPVGQHVPQRINAVGTLVPVGNGVNTTSATSVVAGSNVSVTPASMTNIYVGQKLNFANGTGAAETVVVKQAPAGGTAFVADFANNHSGAYTITSVSGTFIGKLIVITPGTGMTFTLYNGSPNVLPLPIKSGIVTQLVTATLTAGQNYPFESAFDYGAFYTYAGTTPGEFVLTFIDMAQA